jgi:hypothetical protein
MLSLSKHRTLAPRLGAFDRLSMSGVGRSDLGGFQTFRYRTGKCYTCHPFPSENSVKIIIAAVTLSAFVGTSGNASEIVGPGRFCGYSPIIDLLDGEKVTTLEGGIHGGSFRWEGAFGALEVYGIGWASRPKGRIVEDRHSNSPARFAQKRVKGVYQIAIWNGAHGAAYFTSSTPFTEPQLAVIDRVELFEEGQPPSGCKLRTIFSWD